MIEVGRILCSVQQDYFCRLFDFNGKKLKFPISTLFLQSCVTNGLSGVTERSGTLSDRNNSASLLMMMNDYCGVFLRLR